MKRVGHVPARFLSIPLSALVALVVACGSNATPSTGGAFGSALAIPTGLATLGLNGTRFPHAGDLAAALSTAGVRCDASASPSAATGEAERVRCQAGGDDVVLRVFASTDARNGYLAQADAVLGQANVNAVPQLVGPNWLVTADTDATIDRIRQAIGGEIPR